MKYNQFSYIPRPADTCEQELQALGFELNKRQSDKETLEHFCRKIFFNYKDTDYPLHNLIADFETDLLTFFKSDRPLTADIFIPSPFNYSDSHHTLILQIQLTF